MGQHPVRANISISPAVFINPIKGCGESNPSIEIQRPITLQSASCIIGRKVTPQSDQHGRSGALLAINDGINDFGHGVFKFMLIRRALNNLSTNFMHDSRRSPKISERQFYVREGARSSLTVRVAVPICCAKRFSEIMFFNYCIQMSALGINKGLSVEKSGIGGPVGGFKEISGGCKSTSRLHLGNEPPVHATPATPL
jgi:hypothetical protein